MTQCDPWRLDHVVSAVALDKADDIAIELQGLSISYSELEHQSNRIAQTLLADGYGPGHFIAVVARNIAEFAVGCLAVMKAGAAYISLDLRYSHSRIKNVLEQRTASLILSSYWFPDSLAPEGIPVLREFDSWMIIGEPIPMPNMTHTKNAPASLCYTSGTTGAPKGAIITHAGIDGLVNDSAFAPYSSSDRVAQLTTYAFDAATLEVWGSLVNGACLVEVPKSLMTIPRKFEAFLRDQRITSMWMTTSHFNAIASRQPDAFKTLSTLFIGGEAASVNVLQSVFKCGGAPSRLINGYGPTEATCLTTWHPISKADAVNCIIPIGKPIQGRQVSVRDDALQHVPIDKSGELVISGPALANGYIHDEKQTNERFVTDPLAPNQTLYRTGDRAKLNAKGDFIYLGRTDDQIKVRGLRVEVSAVIEALISLNGVASAVVLPRTSEAETQEMIAFVQLNELINSPISEEATASTHLGNNTLRSEMALKVPDYLVPAQIHIVNHFPTTDSGKLDRNALFQSVSTPIQAPAEKDHTSPTSITDTHTLSASQQNELEIRISLIWQNVLGCDCSNTRQDFYDLGGDSLKLIQVIGDIEAEFGYGLNAHDLSWPLTIASLANRISQNAVQAGSATNGAFIIWMRWWLLPVPEAILTTLGKEAPAEILDIPVSISDVSKTQSFERMVSYVEKRLIENCPEGPYRLAGYSYTGLLAYELAQRLRARGKEVELLVLLDSYCGKPLFHRRVSRLLKNGVSKWLIQRFKNNSKLVLSKPALTSIEAKRPEAQYYFSSIASARNHQTTKYAGKTLVIETTDRTAFVLPRWGKRLTGDFSVITIDGDHESIMKRPAQVQKVCDALKNF